LDEFVFLYISMGQLSIKIAYGYKAMQITINICIVVSV